MKIVIKHGEGGEGEGDRPVIGTAEIGLDVLKPLMYDRLEFAKYGILDGEVTPRVSVKTVDPFRIQVKNTMGKPQGWLLVKLQWDPAK